MITTVQPWAHETFPGLSRLGLSADEVRELTKQGSIRRERRGRKTIYRLRFRIQGRQRVRYVSPRDATALEAELAALQRPVRSRRQLSAMADIARRLLRHRKSILAPVIEAAGYHFHGLEIRRRRNFVRRRTQPNDKEVI